MKAPIKAVILPTEDKSNICINLSDSVIIYTTIPVKYPHQDIVQNQHVYATVSQDVEPIKEGDWCIAMDTNIIFQVSNKDLKGINNFKDLYRKIIATTDPKIYADYSTPGTTFVPQVQQSFLKAFAANPDGEYEVEYFEHNHPELGLVDCTVKLNQDNEVSITSIEDKMYTLEQMYLSAANVTHQIAANRGNSEWNMKVTPKMIVNDWIKINLKIK